MDGPDCTDTLDSESGDSLRPTLVGATTATTPLEDDEALLTLRARLDFPFAFAPGRGVSGDAAG